MDGGALDCGGLGGNRTGQLDLRLDF